MPRRLELLLSVAATAVAIAFFVSVPYWPRQDSPNALRLPTSEPAAPLSFATAAPRGPSVLASVKPAPNFNLDLPADVATVAARRGYNGETGLIPTMASITTFRLLATGDLISACMASTRSRPSTAASTSCAGPRTASRTRWLRAR